MKPLALHVFATFAPGGPQVRAARLFAGLGDAWRHVVVALDGDTSARGLVPEAVELALADAPSPGTLSVVRGVRRLVRAHAPALLCTYNWGAIEAVVAARTLRFGAVLHHEDGFRPDEVDAQKGRRRLFRRLVLGGGTTVVVPSDTLRRAALDTWGLPAARVHLVPNGVDARRFERADGNPALRAELGIPADALVVGSVGHLRPEKNPARLIEAVAASGVELHALVLGDGPERGRVEAAAREHGLGARVHLVGHVEDPRPHYRAMDLFALSSDTEQAPVALLEAMACSLPAVATDVGDVRRSLPPEQGELVVPRDAAALALALASLAGDPERRAALGAANRARVENELSFERMLAAHRALWDAARGA